jgi:hypothetical protein
MAAWATRRKLFYVTCTLLLFVLVIVVPAVSKFYKAPTCADAILNQGEEGIDCGGPCPKLCATHFLPPRIVWSRASNIAPGVNNVAAYIINPNNDGIAKSVPYVFSLYDSQGILIIEKKGFIDIPPHKNVIAFEPGLLTDQRVPTRTTFEFSEPPLWQKSDDIDDHIDVSDTDLTQDEEGTALTAKLTNTTILNYKDVVVYAVLYDDEDNSVAFSRTKIDSLPNGAEAQASFTWPQKFTGTIARKEIITVVNKISDPRIRQP